MVPTTINDMHVALVCIAKNEDDYIDEWIQYHLAIGFDIIYVYCNDWWMKTDHPQVVKIQWDGQAMQIPAYNDFLVKYGNQFHWAAFLDVDEFLVLKQDTDIKSFLYQYLKYPAVKIHWRLFGSKVDKKYAATKSVIHRFTHCQQEYNEHVKTIINTSHKDIRNKRVKWLNPHVINFLTWQILPIEAQINHYFCKTYEEFLEKRRRGRADIENTIRDLADFENHNHNVIKDTTLLDLFIKNQNQ